MALILNIETATKNCSVSLAQDGELIAIKERNEQNYSHSEKLHSFILDVFKQAGVEKKSIDAVAVSMGPGSYTGLRIGVSTAKGLCYALDKPLISISTLLSLAHQVKPNQGDKIIPLLDARRMEVYSAVYNHEMQQLVDTTAEIVTEHSFQDLFDEGKVYFLGDGAQKCVEIIKNDSARFLSGKFPSSREMTKLSYEKYLLKDFEDVAYFEPYYLKDFIAGKPKKYFN